MRVPARSLLTGCLSLLICGQTACNLVPQDTYRASQYQAYRLHQQGAWLAQQRDQQALMAQALATEKAQLAQQLASTQSQLSTAEERIANLRDGNSKLQERFIGLTRRLREEGSPLSDSTTRRFEELAKKYPEFEFDPQTGVSKFHSDILFDSGSDVLKPKGQALMKEFAQIMGSGDATRLNILVVGHTDDMAIRKSGTKQQHPTNWHLSTNRANSVVTLLAKQGIGPDRMGAAGYSMYQPVVPNQGDGSRQLNRRVEIYVLAPDAQVAGWDAPGRF
ncbi:MAG: OmpA family protein [Planctomycetaceae bacterium]|nr:OmpA family protein [Planctomycetaceae bacterium]